MKNRLAFALLAMHFGLVPMTAQAVPVVKTSPGAAKTLPTKVALAGFDVLPGSSKMDNFVSHLMQQMTLDEKIGQLNLLSVGADVTGPVLSEGVEEKISKGQVGGVFNIYGPSSVRKLQQMVVEKSRLKIPLIFGYDVIHGHRTVFPINLGLSSSWDVELIEKTAAAAADEASADGLNWTFSPMVDIARDPRWGRVSEGAGEDAYLGSQIAKAMVYGYQGRAWGGATALPTDKVMACVKHFALYGAAEAGRDYNTVDMSRVRMYNEYFPPYKAAVEANVASAMSSFNEIDGMPASGNKWLMTDLLRKDWGFKGFVCTDYTAIPEMIEHGVGDEKKVAELALNAGIDMDMVGELFTKYGAQLVKSGAVSVAQIDAACRRVLEAKYKLGLFEDPYRYISEERKKTQTMSSEKLALTKEAAIKSMVLLKNDKQTLPLNVDQKIAFIGPLVKDQRNVIGSWSGAGQGKEATSLWTALEAKYGAKLADKVIYAKGCNLLDDIALNSKLNRDGGELSLDEKSPQVMIDEAVAAAKQADVVVAVLGEPFSMSGEAASRSDIGLFENQLNLLKALKATGKPIALVLLNGRPLTLSWESKNLDAILEAWHGGTAAGAAMADVLYGVANPSGKLSMTFPRNVGQVPIYYGVKNTGRPFVPNSKYHSQYLDVSNDPLYPFGYGLSYTEFDCGAPVLSVGESSAAAFKSPAKLSVNVTVTNKGKYDGVETVQLYTRDLVGSITRPVKELKGFQKVALKAGESKTISFTVAESDLRFYNSELKYQSEPGDFKVMVGANSRDVKEAKFTLLP